MLAGRTLVVPTLFGEEAMCIRPYMLSGATSKAEIDVNN